MGTVSDGRRKESPYDPLLPDGSGRRRHTSAFHRAFSPIEALMSCPPAEDPVESVLEQIALREALADALDNLEEDDRWIFDMLIVVRLSLRFVGRVVGLPKTTLARRRDTIVAGLQEQLLENPVVRERFRDHYDQTL